MLLTPAACTIKGPNCTATESARSSPMACTTLSATAQTFAHETHQMLDSASRLSCVPVGKHDEQVVPDPTAKMPRNLLEDDIQNPSAQHQTASSARATHQ
ncbi:hypothetical protein EJ03DRAFT_59240 [Teratosphaeria nubilosa]|uniref:Uncharacterized protein n=1 Tax=Teratosphaeria nubilosa TaxID=161662 RepID=A0A6G1LDB4_9PEZI|nr:hypothetical protein EJ03DRAFT_59240 [Teratosphaeria nubilosa]